MKNTKSRWPTGVRVVIALVDAHQIVRVFSFDMIFRDPDQVFRGEQTLSFGES